MLYQNEKSEAWLRTGVNGALDSSERFSVLEPANR
jgi:hypothetical protein